MNRLILLAPSLLIACGAPGSSDDDDGILDPPIEDNCPAMYQQDVLPEYYVDIAPAEWDAMQDEFLHRVDREAAGLDIHPYHPVQFRMVVDGESTEQVANVLMRLKGASSWLQTIDLDPNPKMQFVIAFNEINPDGRFQGVRKVELDMPRHDMTFMQQRLALGALRSAGIPAQCANSARLYINGEFYGLYTNLERLDKEFLQRNFGEKDEGDLWSSGRIIKTNEDTFTWDRLDALWHTTTVAETEALVDYDAALEEWAFEAVIGDADGYYNGRANFYLYDHPDRGFVWIPHDLDTVFDPIYLFEDAPPVFPSCMARWERDWHHYIQAMNDMPTVDRYADAVADARARYDVAAMQAHVDAWSAQIVSSVEEDQHRWFTMDDHYLAVARDRDYMAVRAAYIDEWLSCRSGGGADADGDGFDMCHDCADDDNTVRPGATETCNLRDDDCDGRVDSLAGATVCE